MRPDSRAYSIITESGLKRQLLTDSYKVSSTAPSGPEGTTNGWSDSPGKSRIDYVFVKTGIEVSSISTIVKKEGPMFISDHWPVRAVIGL
jgi:endonuclease/exonuclease/phosphatase family metal-dependent hydrolase